jgi:hypothetical protein
MNQILLALLMLALSVANNLRFGIASSKASRFLPLQGAPPLGSETRASHECSRLTNDELFVSFAGEQQSDA